MRASSAFSMYGLVTSRSALAAESWAAIFATRVLRWTCTARYHSEATTPNAPMACAMALIASQFIRCRSCESLRLVRDLQHNLAERVMGLDLLMRFSRFRQWKSLRNRRHYLFCLDQLRKLFEDFCLGMRTQSSAADAALDAFSLVRIIRDRNDDAAFFDHAVGATERVGADTIENNIDIPDHVFKFRRRVIDRLIDFKLLEQILVRRLR